MPYNEWKNGRLNCYNEREIILLSLGYRISYRNKIESFFKVIHPE